MSGVHMPVGDVDLKWLEDFACLARTRNFSRASIERHVTQSAFSRRIAALEAWLGSPLVDRSSNPVALTRDGARFLETAQTVVQLLHAGREELRLERSGQAPVVAVAALHTLALGFFPKWFQEVSRTVERVESRVLADGLNECLDAIRAGACDLMLVLHHEYVPIALDAGVFPHVVVGHDRLALMGTVEGAAGRDMPLLGYPAGSFFGRMTSFAMRDHLEPDRRIAHVNDSAIALKSMVLSGHGIAWLPRSLVENEIASGMLFILDVEVPLALRLYRNTRRRNRAVDAIWEIAGRYRHG